MAKSYQLKIYLEQGFLEEFEKLPHNKSYGVQYLWELADETNLFILDYPLTNDIKERINQTKYTKKIIYNNDRTKNEIPLSFAHLLFITEKNRDKIKTTGMIFTLEDFEERIEEYANLPNFINFLQSDADWNLLLKDFKKFPYQNLSLVDSYFFGDEANIAVFDELFIDNFLIENLSIYTNTENEYKKENGKWILKCDKPPLIKKTAENLSGIIKSEKLAINKTSVKDTRVNKLLKTNIHWHDREIVSDYAIMISGIGFKGRYSSNTNNKLVQFNIFTKDGRDLIKEQHQKFQKFDKIDAKYRVYKYNDK